jgi:hypothetical protein
MNSDKIGLSNRSNTEEILIFERLPWGASTCSEVMLFERIVPTLKVPLSS